MTTLLVWLFVLLLLAAAVVVGLWGYRAYLTGDTSLTWGNWFGAAAGAAPRRHRAGQRRRPAQAGADPPR